MYYYINNLDIYDYLVYIGSQYTTMDDSVGVLFGACVITLVNAAGPRSFSIIYLDIMDIYHSSAAGAAAVGSLLAGVQVFAGKGLHTLIKSAYIMKKDYIGWLQTCMHTYIHTHTHTHTHVHQGWGEARLQVQKPITYF